MVSSLQSYITPLLNLNRESRLFIADYLYTHSEEEDLMDERLASTMPGIFTQEERDKRLQESLACKEGKSLEEVIALMLAV